MKFPTHFKCTFGGYPKEDTESRILLFGVPRYITSIGLKPIIDSTILLRIYSYDLEDYSKLYNIFYEDIPVCDIGDIYTLNFDDINMDISTILNYCKKRTLIPFMIGGEHTFTYFTIKLIKPKSIIIFDAHLDMRDTYCNDKFNYATFLRRLYETVKFEKIIYIGSRAYSKEELQFIQKNATKEKIYLINPKKEMKEIRKYLDDLIINPIYVSIDLDVIDPTYIKLVSAPEPNGLKPSDLFSFLKYLSNYQILGFDVMEFAPYTLELTSINYVTKIIYEGLATIWKSIQQS